MDHGLTLIELAKFTGKEARYYELFVAEALEQAGDLFELATALSVMPGAGLDLRLAQRGILAMAEVLYEAQPHRDMRFAPFRSETIGSYSYSRVTGLEASVLAGIPTGVSWFDLAVSRLKTGVSTVGNTSIHAFDRPGDLTSVATATGDETYLPGPADSSSYRGSPVVSGGCGGSGGFVDGGGWSDF